MDYSDPGQRYQKGMNFDEKMNFSYELEQEIKGNKDELAEQRERSEGDACIEDLPTRIKKNEILLQDVQNDIHGL